MPLIVQEATIPRCPRDFALAAAQNQQLTDLEQRCLDRVNQYIDYLATIPSDNTPRGLALISLRNQMWLCSTIGPPKLSATY